MSAKAHLSKFSPFESYNVIDQCSHIHQTHYRAIACPFCLGPHICAGIIAALIPSSPVC
uniref:Uncharacterized protein n=1 Tax=Anguilla anguilla TaxID=7936 RepID=A0A0E9TQM3_ANGAN